MIDIRSQLYKGIKTIEQHGFSHTVKSIYNLVYGLGSYKARYYSHRFKWGGACADPKNIIWIDPKKPQYQLKPQFSRDISSYGTHVISGDWDRRTYSSGTRGLQKLENNIFHKSLKNHFVNDVSWENTGFYQLRLKNPTIRYNSKQRLDERLSEVDSLYDSIKENGYVTQIKLNNSNENPLGQDPIIPEFNEVKVNIGRGGEIIYEDGRHRRSIARILNLDEIPVRVLVRHSRWQEKRRTMYHNLKNGELSVSSMEYRNHPDVQDLLV